MRDQTWPMFEAVDSAQIQGWVAIFGGLGAAVVGMLKYFDFRSRRERAAAVGQAFVATVDALASADQPRQLAAAILLRRFFDRRAEQGGKDAPYAHEAIGVIAATLRVSSPGVLQKLLADGLGYATDLRDADLQQCRLTNAYLGSRADRSCDLSRADFFEADLSGASLKGATAREAVFYRAVLSNTVLDGCDLAGADFRDANVVGARFRGARLDGARFAGASGVPDDITARLNPDGVVR